MDNVLPLPTNVKSMNNEFVSNSSNEYDPVEQRYNLIHGALSAKPHLLQTILQSSKLQAHEDAVTALKKETVVKQDIPERLNHAEKIYQKSLNLQAEQLVSLYKNLPIDRKIDLLIYAEEVGEINEKARKLASQQMQADRAKVFADHHAVLGSLHTLTNESIRPPTNIQIIAKPQPATSSKEATPEQPQEKGLINQVGLGNPAAVTINLPFTAIPGLPALSKILEKIDKTTHFDLGFTFKGVADQVPNPNGGHDLLYRLSYAGTGIMSSQVNVQVAPIALKLQESVDQDKWGGNSSIFTRHKADNSGTKYSVNFNDSDGSVSFAHEYSYQKPSNKIISTLTGGHHFSRENGPALRIPAELVPTLDRIVKALPNEEEANVIFDRIDKVIPINQAIKVASSIIDSVDKNIVSEQPFLTASMYVLKQKIAESGLSAKAQEEVLARACENCDKNATQGSLPAIAIKEKTPTAPAISLDQ